MTDAGSEVVVLSSVGAFVVMTDTGTEVVVLSSIGVLVMVIDPVVEVVVPSTKVAGVVNVDAVVAVEADVVVRIDGVVGRAREDWVLVVVEAEVVGRVDSVDIGPDVVVDVDIVVVTKASLLGRYQPYASAMPG